MRRRMAAIVLVLLAIGGVAGYAYLHQTQGRPSTRAGSKPTSCS